MTIDEITTALQEWRGDDEEKHYLLLAVDDEDMTASVQGKGFHLGGALALAMDKREETRRLVRWAMALKEMDIFSDQDNDNKQDNDKG